MIVTPISLNVIIDFVKVKLHLNGDIQQFIASNGLDTDLLDERSESLEAWRQGWEGLAKGFMNYLQDGFASIEQRLDRLERLVGQRCGYRKT